MNCKKGYISISRVYSGRGREYDYIEITIEDEHYNLKNKVNMGLEGFARAITGNGNIECEIMCSEVEE